jgi:hypothetical protein
MDFSGFFEDDGMPLFESDPNKKPVMLPLWAPLSAIAFLSCTSMETINKLSVALVIQLVSFVYLRVIAYGEPLFTWKLWWK